MTVTDTTAPIVTTPGDMTVDAAGTVGALATFEGVTASDLVDGQLPVVCDHASDEMFAVGTTTVTCSATDAAGNKGSASFDVTTLAPVRVGSSSLSAPSSGPLPRTGRNIWAAVLFGIALILIGLLLRRMRRRGLDNG